MSTRTFGVIMSMATAAEKVERQCRYDVIGSKAELGLAKEAAAAAKNAVQEIAGPAWDRKWDDLYKGKDAPFMSKEDLVCQVIQILKGCPETVEVTDYMQDFKVIAYSRDLKPYVVDGLTLWDAYRSALASVKKQDATKVRREANARLGVAKSEVIIRRHTLKEAEKQNDLRTLADRTIIGKVQKRDQLLKQERTAFNALATFAEGRKKN